MKNRDYNFTLLVFLGIMFMVVLASRLKAEQIDYVKIAVREPLDVVMRPDKTLLSLDVGIGSGAFHHQDDPDNVIYTVTDRGPNIKTADAEELLGLDMKDKKGKIFPTTNFSPTIYKIAVHENSYEILEKTQMKNRQGHAITGISNPDTEAAWDVNGTPLEYDPEGVDAEGIVKLRDGTFWIGEEYGPSLLHVAADGRVIERWVPQGVAQTLAGAKFDIVEKLPEIFRHRWLNRGIESMAVSPDEQYLYFTVQSPLANPDKAAYSKGRNVRVLRVNLKERNVDGEYVYLMDTPDTFAADNAKKKRKQNDVKVSELCAVGQDKLLVLERISKTTKFYLVELSEEANILGSKWDNLSTSPSLEQLSQEQAQQENIVLLKKKLALDTDSIKGFPSKIEGMAWIGGSNWILVNDNDFGIENAETFLIRANIPTE